MGGKRKRSVNGYKVTKKQYKAAARIAKAIKTARRGGYGNWRSGGNQRVESKFKDYSVDAHSITTFNSFGGSYDLNPVDQRCLNTVVQGAGESARVGRNIYINSLYIRGLIHIGASNNINTLIHSVRVRLWLVLDKNNNNQVTLDSGEVFAIPPITESGTSGDMYSNVLLNPEFSQRFKILKYIDVIMDVPNMVQNSANTNKTVGGIQRDFTIFQEFKKPLRTSFFGSSQPATASLITDNGLYLIGGCTDPSTRPVVISYNARLRYTD